MFIMRDIEFLNNKKILRFLMSFFFNKRHNLFNNLLI